MQILHLKIWPVWQVLTDEEEQEKLGIPKNVKDTFIKYNLLWLFPSISTTYLASPQTSFGVRLSCIHLMNAWQTNPKGRLRGGYYLPNGLFTMLNLILTLSKLWYMWSNEAMKLKVIHLMFRYWEVSLGAVFALGDQILKSELKIWDTAKFYDTTYWVWLL